MRIGDRTHTSSVIVTATALIAPWRPHARRRTHRRRTSSRCSRSRPRSCCSAPARGSSFPHAELLRTCTQRRIGIEVMDTSAACRTYNVLVAEGRNVAAALIV